MKRRRFLTATAAAAASTVFPRFAIGKPGKSANGKLNIAFIGSGGWIAQQPYNQGCSEENLVAFCDVNCKLCAGDRIRQSVQPVRAGLIEIATRSIAATTGRRWATT